MGSIVKLSCQAVAALALGVGLCTPRLAPADEVHGQIRALPVATGVRLDGRLDEPFWAAADSVADFRQREPTEGAPASERTVVKLARDASALYVGVRALDHDVAHVRATQLRRDADLEGDDNVVLLLDSFHDRRGAFVFATNPNGLMWDAQLTGADDLDQNWNGIWAVASSRDSLGWSAEFQIPFATLRYHPGTHLRFGFNARRINPRKNEEDLWRSYGRAQGLYQLQNAGVIIDLDDVRRGRDIELLPYALGRLLEAEHDLAGAATSRAVSAGRVGFDAKVAATPTMTADLTLNTDFAQVEADQQVINLTRFPLFFPEKRRFFLESNSLFSFGSESSALLFYSRRIGLRESQPVPIIAGGRLYGRLGAWSLGVLEARTGGAEAANDAVIRVRRDVLERGYVGAVGTLRSGPGVDGFEGATGVDLDLPLVIHGRNLEPYAWIASTHTPGAGDGAVAWRVATDYPNDLWDIFASTSRVSSGFSPPLGFVRRTGVLGTIGHVDFMPRPHFLGVRQLDFEIPVPSWDILANDTGSLARSADWQTANFTWLPLGGVLQSGDQFDVTVQRALDAPPDTFNLFRDVRLPPRRYWWTRTGVTLATSAGRPLSASVTASSGDFYDGRNRAFDLGATWRGGGRLILGAGLTQSAVRLPEGTFEARAASARIEYAFSTRSDLLVFAQYTNDDDRADFNVRFHWARVIGDDVYLVWNSGYTTDPAARFRFPSRDALERPLNGALVLKIVHRMGL